MRKPLYPLFLLLLLLAMPLCARAATVSGHVWYDEGDGVYGARSRAQRGVAITLCRLDESGVETQLETQYSDGNGLFSFTDVPAGDYRLRATLPEDHQFILPRTGGSVMLPAAGQRSASLPFSLAENEEKSDMNVGLSKASCYVRATLFVDRNQNGGRSTAEDLLTGVPVALYYEMDGEWIEIARLDSDREGNATFWDLTPGVYRLSADLPEPYIIGPLGEKINAWYNCIPPCDSGFGMSAPFEITRGNSLGMGVGAVSTGNLQGSLWDDLDMDGKRGLNEGGFAGATVTLVSESAGVNRAAASGEDGRYRFERLLAGEYTLTVTLPQSAMFTLPGGDSFFSDGYSFSQSVSVSVQDQMETQIQAIGVMPVTSLTVSVYNDLDADGVRDADEPVFAGALVEALSDDAVCASALSGGDGLAALPVLRGGEAVVLRCTLPAGQVFTVEGADNDFYAPAATGNLTLSLSVPHGAHTALSAGVTQPAAISGVLFDDANVSGVRDENEAGLAGLTVQAVSESGQVVAQTETDETGCYAFHNLLPSAHAIRFLLVDAYVFPAYSETGAAADENRVQLQTAEYGQTALFALTPGQSLEHISAGAFRSATVSGAVLQSTGIATLPASGGLAGVRVSLLDADGAPLHNAPTVLTDENGHFYLKGALPGVYRIEYQLPERAAFTQPETGLDTLITDPLTLESADDVTLDTLFAIPTGSLSGTLYHDRNLNGVYDEGEATLANVKMTLENTDLGQIYETSTLDNGQYILESLRPGAYTLHMTLPDGYCFAAAPSSLVAAQSSGDAVADFSVGIGETLAARDIAAAHPALLSGLLFWDANNNGAFDEGEAGAPGVTLSLKAVDTALSYTLQTTEDGLFSLDALVPGDYTLRVTLEGDCIPADGNPAERIDGFWCSPLSFGDGEAVAPEYAVLRYARISGQVWNMDGSLSGVGGRTVTLCDGGGAPLQTALTDAQGAFTFENLKPGLYSFGCDLPDDTYRFARSVDTAERASLIQADRSAIDGLFGQSSAVSLSMGERLAACDFGIGAMGSLGDTAWIDENGNGLQDGGEPNLPGLQIALYQYGELVAETVTDVFGHYRISGLYPGLYTVRVTMPEEVRATVHVTEFPLVASVLTESEGTTAQGENILVPSGGRNLNCDFGFVLVKEGVYPASLEQTPQTDWSFSSK